MLLTAPLFHSVLQLNGVPVVNVLPCPHFSSTGPFGGFHVLPIERVLPWKSRCWCHFEWWFSVDRASLIARLVKNPPAMQKTPVRFLRQQDPLEKGWATHSSILGLPLWLSWLRICLQCRRPGLDPWVGKFPWRRERLPTPVFWPREFHGLYSP